MIPRRISILLVVVLAGCGHGRAQPPGSGLPRQLLLVDGGFKIDVRREAQEQLQQRLIQIAESTPPRSGGRWWCSRLDGTRIASTVTGDALAYYLNRIQRLRETGGRTRRGLRMTAAELDYRAEATRLDPDRFEVRLSLSWLQVCGNLCVLSFERQRAVVLSADGEVLEVRGDDDHSFTVS